MKLQISLVVVLLLSMIGCQQATFTPEQQQLQIQQAKQVVDSLKDVSTQLGTVSQGFKDVKTAVLEQAATRPELAAGGKPVVHAADEASKALDQAKVYTDSVAKVADTFQKALEIQGQQNASVIDKLSAVTTAAATITHETVPSTPADNYASLTAVLMLGISKIVSSFNNKATLKTAITTPGTTPTVPEAKR